MRGPPRPDSCPAHQQQQQPVLAGQQNPILAAAPQTPNVEQPPQQPAAYRQQPQRSCFNCDDPTNFVIDCPSKDRARKTVQQAVNSCRTSVAGEWTCPSNPRGMNNDIVPVALPEEAITAFCINFGRTGHMASECMVPENAATEECSNGVVRPCHEIRGL